MNKRINKRKEESDVYGGVSRACFAQLLLILSRAGQGAHGHDLVKLILDV